MEEYTAELVYKLNEIIRIQSEVINDLYELLGMHICAEALDQLPTNEKINEAARIRAEIGTAVTTYIS